jgi:hypothetical protein
MQHTSVELPLQIALVLFLALPFLAIAGMRHDQIGDDI